MPCLGIEPKTLVYGVDAPTHGATQPREFVFNHFPQHLPLVPGLRLGLHCCHFWDSKAHPTGVPRPELGAHGTGSTQLIILPHTEVSGGPVPKSSSYVIKKTPAGRPPPDSYITLSPD